MALLTAVCLAFGLTLLCVLQSNSVNGNGIDCYTDPAAAIGLTWIRCPDKWTCYTKRVIGNEAVASVTKGCAKNVDSRKMECSWSGVDSNTATQMCYCNGNLCNTNSAGKNGHAGITGAVIAAVAIYFTSSR